jgi:hypothetical protein
MIMKNTRLKFIVLIVISLLLIPLIAMQFTEEVNWTPMDFVFAGVLLLATGLIFDLVFRKVKNINYRIVILTILMLVLLLIWAELAVGIFGTPFSGS